MELFSSRSCSGLDPIIWTDLIQTGLMIIGAAILMVVSFHQIGTEKVVFAQYSQSEPNRTAYHIEEECNKIDPKAASLFRSHNNSFLPWPGVIFGLPVITVWYWCVDEVMVEKVLSSKNVTHAKSAAVMVAYMKLLSMHFLVIPGMIARSLFPDDIGCAGPKACMAVCNNMRSCTDLAYPVLVTELLPHGLQGFMVTVLLSALVTSLTGVFATTSTTFTIDVWAVFRKNCSPTELLLVGRLFILAMVICCLALVPMFEVAPSGKVFSYASNITGTLAAPSVAITILAIFWERLTEPAAFWSFCVGLLVGLAKILGGLIFTVHQCGDRPVEHGTGPMYDVLQMIIQDFHYLYFSASMFGFVFITAIIISLFTTPVPKTQLQRLTFWRRHSKLPNVMPPHLVAVQSAASQNEDGAALHNAPRRILPIFNRIAGVGTSEGVSTAPTVTSAAAQAEMIKMANLALEESKWKRVNDLNAFIILVILVFIYIYYG